MALLLLNCSVDTSSFFNTQTFANSSNNHQESIIEIIVEQFLGFENAIPENNTDEIEQQSLVKKAQLIDIFIVPDFSLSSKYYNLEICKTQYVSLEQCLSKTSFKIPSPPPEINCTTSLFLS